MHVVVVVVVVVVEVVVVVVVVIIVVVVVVVQARTQGGCPGNHLFVLKFLVQFEQKSCINFIWPFLQYWMKLIKRAAPDAEISDNLNGPHYDLALYPTLHDIFDFLYFLRVHKLVILEF